LTANSRYIIIILIKIVIKNIGELPEKTTYIIKFYVGGKNG
jgi:hypothetical protein